ncbi:MAG TPA: 3-dehydroquinate synthase family protein, partial [Vicinamibacteria bacterium]|nr:3-dehydroquinate synthase family protein [Vicinamibacteria bacterium]
MHEVAVPLAERSYTVTIGEGALARLPDVLGAIGRRRVALVSSPRVFARQGERVRAALAGVDAVEVLVPDGEPRKTLRTVERVHDALLSAGLGRDGVLVAFGGGVIGDVAGFAAATYMRGIDCVQAPTTLLAMVDSAIGGKVGVNHPRAKNLVGAFHQPRAVLADLRVLETLPARQLRGGAYEMLKCGILGDAPLFETFERSPARLSRWPPEVRAAAIAAACRVKAEVVAGDEREGGHRRVLNLGHTVGHALESVTGYRRFTHGEAVGWGLVAAAWIARALRRLSAADHDRIVRAV